MRLRHFLTGLILGLLTISCKKDFLKTAPTDATNANQAYATTKGCYTALEGINRLMYMQSDYNGTYNMDQCGQQSTNIRMDMMGADNVSSGSGNGWYNESYDWTGHRSATGRETRYLYYYYYRIIRNANGLIENTGNATGSEGERKSIKGQAYVYRAWSHFMLVQLFAQRYDAAKSNDQPGVVYQTFSQDFSPKPRATVENVYKQINGDLDSAISLLSPNVPVRDDVSNIDLSVAKGIKARVALVMQDWNNAVKYASEACVGYSLMTNAQYLSGFNDFTNPEWMWGSRVISDQNNYFYSFFAFMSPNFNSTFIRTNTRLINSSLYKMIPATDIRAKCWDPSGEYTLTQPPKKKLPYVTKKFLAQDAGSSLGDLVYMRSAEMYLIQAEAKARMNDDEGAKNVLEILLKNRNPSGYQRPTEIGNALVQYVLAQRRIELWGEGFAFLDLKRCNLALNRTSANHDAALCRILQMPSGDKQWQFLIPQDEINATGGIVTQNEL
ncbi:RagB/SusD family nutrient uptake outer membrane protein [Danxiaibacter flavus]|uniref:RagB/SusD family nutrient uptake outer membrane protein n=1 Tax=Danxiaibacter flavus TaxID=3049108 RepID=A0ABV3Z9R1_9BACT|nr:RagB/SusD family nutrient uptake outer membrane protein [Chitinophagaceae bacterium DXS]